jgi:transposase
MATKYKVFLTSEERSRLQGIVQTGERPARAILSAQVLLFADAGPEGRGKMTNAQISLESGVSERTIESAKRRYLAGGLPLALERKRKTIKAESLKIGPELQARVLALAQSTPPEGRTRWTTRLLAEKLVEEGAAPSGISHMSVHRLLKKMKAEFAPKSPEKAPPRKAARS